MGKIARFLGLEKQEDSPMTLSDVQSIGSELSKVSRGTAISEHNQVLLIFDDVQTAFAQLRKTQTAENSLYEQFKGEPQSENVKTLRRKYQPSSKELDIQERRLKKSIQSALIKLGNKLNVLERRHKDLGVKSKTVLRPLFDRLGSEVGLKSDVIKLIYR